MKPKTYYGADMQKEKTSEAPVKNVTAETVGEVVNVKQYLNVRSTPKVEVGNIVAILEKGTKLIVVDKKPETHNGEDWLKVKVKSVGPGPKYLEGYAMNKYIKVL